MYLVIPTKYDNLKNLRITFLKKTLVKANLNNYIKKIIIIDNSCDIVYNYIKNIITDKMILLKIDKPEELKGGGIRDGIKFIIKNFGISNTIAFQEGEKYDMIDYYETILNNIKYDKFICNPRRNKETWITYPKEQYFSENFLNMYLSKITNLDIDWTFGPVIFSGNVSKYWLKSEGKLWDSQIGPIYEAYLDNIKIIEHEINYKHPKEQKLLEENNLNYISKRKYQMDVMIKEILSINSRIK